ncbi:MAG: hypothetical protein ACYS8W_21665, partial [Planctomycetota bacterium]
MKIYKIRLSILALAMLLMFPACTSKTGDSEKISLDSYRTSGNNDRPADGFVGLPAVYNSGSHVSFAPGLQNVDPSRAESVTVTWRGYSSTFEKNGYPLARLYINGTEVTYTANPDQDADAPYYIASAEI